MNKQCGEDNKPLFFLQLHKEFILHYTEFVNRILSLSLSLCLHEMSRDLLRIQTLPQHLT